MSEGQLSAMTNVDIKLSYEKLIETAMSLFGGGKVGLQSPVR